MFICVWEVRILLFFLFEILKWKEQQTYKQLLYTGACFTVTKSKFCSEYLFLLVAMATRLARNLQKSFWHSQAGAGRRRPRMFRNAWHAQQIWSLGPAKQTSQDSKQPAEQLEDETSKKRKRAEELLGDEGEDEIWKRWLREKNCNSILNCCALWAFPLCQSWIVVIVPFYF